MNLASPWNRISKITFRIALKLRKLLPKSRSKAFGQSRTKNRPNIERIYVINLDRQPSRWSEIERELRHILDENGESIWNITERYSAVDARSLATSPTENVDIDSDYTLGDQLFVEPQPLTLPNRIELNSPIRMSLPEIAIAKSHIGVWRKFVASNYEHALILEDDVWFRPGFTSQIDQAWQEIEAEAIGKENFDILYLSYEEAKGGAPKTFLSNSVFRPTRGMWHLSGYVISREGARKLLRLLPCRGPIDLWINHQFSVLDVRATRSSIISQRRDGSSTNSYSVLPSLTKIGAISSEGAALFQVRPSKTPVFVFGPEDSGLTSLAMALSMLGYRCCSDLQELPSKELQRLLSGNSDRVFDAYVNINTLEKEVQSLRKRYPEAKFIATTNNNPKNEKYQAVLDSLDGADLASLDLMALNKWQVVCEHLRCVPPTCSFPELADLGQRQITFRTTGLSTQKGAKKPKHDESPWVVEPRSWWRGVHAVPTAKSGLTGTSLVRVVDHLEYLNPELWLSREDTFTDNLALFRPYNIEFHPKQGAKLNVRKEHLGVREYSAAALTSKDRYLFGRFEAVIRASNTPGVVTGFFLHRDSPRQEIDIEISGNRPDRLLVNVFYNPGGEGANFDYGYRGTVSYIDLGFDASKSDHTFAIEWSPSEIRWFVDNNLVHSRANWEPTPIPHLPMSLHLNIWPTRSKELAGRLISRKLPTATFVKSIALEANALRKPQ